MNTITESEAFYGYIIGLQIERCPEPGPESTVGSKLFAIFEYGADSSVWEVPDLNLFLMLSHHLYRMAKSRHTTDDYGYEKLRIKKEQGTWSVSIS